MPPPVVAPAASRVPSAEEAMEVQAAKGTLDGVHVAPPFVEV